MLIPPQRGRRILFFVGPYAELDGGSYPSLERHVSFSEVSF